MTGARTRLLVMALAGCLVTPACRKRLSAQDQVREAVAEAVDGVREHKLKRVAAIVSTQYVDKEGHDRQAVVDIVRAHILLHRNLYIFSRISTIDCNEPGLCNATVLAAMAAVPGASPADLVKAQADVYRFTLRFVDEDGAWRVRNASWSRASVKDLL
jgi:hypothetical protein